MELTPVDVQKALLGVRWPASTATLLRHVTAAGAPEEIIRALQSLPEREFGSSREVLAAMRV